MKALKWGIGLVLLATLISKCGSDIRKDYNAYGVISDVGKREVQVDVLMPDSLRKGVRDCQVVSKSEEKVECQESKGSLSFTHSLTEREIKNKEEVVIGNNIQVRLPLLKQESLSVHRQYVKLSSFQMAVGTSVFVKGQMKDKDVKVEGVYKSESAPIGTQVGVVLVCVRPFSNELLMYRQEGESIGVYNLMFPSVIKDHVGSGDILGSDDHISQGKLISFSPDMREVLGISLDPSESQCINQESTPIPTWKEKVRTISGSVDVSKGVGESVNKGGGMDINLGTILLFISIPCISCYICTQLF